MIGNFKKPLVATAAILAFSLSSAQAAQTITNLDGGNTFTGGTINSAQFVGENTQPAGTGVFGSFVRLQQKGNEQGINTDLRPITTSNEVKTDTNFTRSLQLSSLMSVIHNGVDSYVFRLDVNEAGGDGGVISLNQVQIFLGTAGNLAPTEAELTSTGVTGSKPPVLTFGAASSEI